MQALLAGCTVLWGALPGAALVSPVSAIDPPGRMAITPPSASAQDFFAVPIRAMRRPPEPGFGQLVPSRFGEPARPWLDPGSHWLMLPLGRETPLRMRMNLLPGPGGLAGYQILTTSSLLGVTGELALTVDSLDTLRLQPLAPRHAFTGPTTVPEPRTLALVGLGVGALAIMRRTTQARRRRAQEGRWAGRSGQRGASWTSWSVRSCPAGASTASTESGAASTTG